MTADTLLQHLDGVKRTGAETWLARCPAHDDKRPSLSVRETGDGRVLLNCWAGCATGDVLAAVGLTFSDLFPPDPSRTDHRQRGERRPFPAADVLRAVAQESLLVAIAAARVCDGHPLTDDGRARLMLAAQRLQAAADASGVSRHG